jgi:ABC-2 type transport system ATP-binding protein
VHAVASILEVEDLTKVYGRVRALSNVSFSVAEGEVFGFLGPNGAGKTTTIRILLGMQRASGGTARVGGKDCWTDHPSAARLFGATLEQPALYGFLSARDNLRMFARTLGPVDEKQITDLLATVGLTERANDKVKRYSMGMRQRLALAQAMLGRPRLLILDEPTNGLDPNGIHGLRLLLRKLATEEGMTIFFSSHLLSEVEELCDRVVVLNRGEVKAAGPLSELMNIKGFKYRIDVSDVDHAISVVHTLDGVTAEPDTIKDSIVVTSDRDMARIINHALVAAGIGVDQLVRQQRGLEDIYIELTGVAPGSPLSGAPPPPVPSSAPPAAPIGAPTS